MEEKKEEEETTEVKEVVKEASVKEQNEETSTEEGIEVEMTTEQKKFIEQIEKMSVLELHQLVKVLEKKFDVSASAAVVAAPGTEGNAVEEKDSFTVELTAVGDQKIQVIKAIKEILGLGLKEAKDMTDGAPTVLKEGVKKEEAEEIKTKIEGAGGKITLK